MNGRWTVPLAIRCTSDATEPLNSIYSAVMKTILHTVFAVAGFAVLCAYAVEPAATLFENNDVKVVRALEKPHVKGSFHEHKTNRVMVYLQGGKQRFEYQDTRKPVVFDWKAGQVEWSVPEGMHSPEVVSDEPFNIVEIELKKPAGGAGAPSTKYSPKADGRQYKLELENPQVRVLRLMLAPHQSVSKESSLNTVAVFLTDEDASVTDAAGKLEPVKHKAGDAIWEMPGKSKIENTGSAPLEIVLVQLKN